MICFGEDFKNYPLFSKWINSNEKFVRLNRDNDYFFFKELQSFLAIKETFSKTSDNADIAKY